jgi:hypothetical protein
MMMRTVAVVTLLVSVATLAHAQTLADVARSEETRRKKVPKTSKVYTNDDLRADFTAPAPPDEPSASTTGDAAARPANQPGAAAAGGSTAARPAAGDPAATPALRDQAYWSGRINAARSAVERNRLFIDALQSRINALTTDFVNRDDPAQRAVIEQDRLKAKAELERVQKEIEDGTKAIAAIEEEARRAGVPSGWLR